MSQWPPEKQRQAAFAIKAADPLTATPQALSGRLGRRPKASRQHLGSILGIAALFGLEALDLAPQGTQARGGLGYEFCIAGLAKTDREDALKPKPAIKPNNKRMTTLGKSFMLLLC